MRRGRFGEAISENLARTRRRERNARRLSVPLIALLCALLPESSTHSQPAPLIETYEVRVASIEVVVTDAKGNPIRGLDASHFTVYENDVAQAITNTAPGDFDRTKGYIRPQAQSLERRLPEPRRFIQVVAGPRQVGKTALVQRVIERSGLGSVV